MLYQMPSSPHRSTSCLSSAESTNFDEIACHYERYLLESALNRSLYTQAAQILAPLCGKRILDYGCGPGVFVESLATLGAEMYGTDASSAMLELACSVHGSGVHYLAYRANRVLVNDETFDAVLCVLVAVSQPSRGSLLNMFREIFRLMKQGATLILGDAQPATLHRCNRVGRYGVRPGRCEDHALRAGDSIRLFFELPKIGVVFDVIDYCWPVSLHCELLVRAGFQIVRVSEDGLSIIIVAQRPVSQGQTWYWDRLPQGTWLNLVSDNRGSGCPGSVNRHSLFS